MSSMTRKVLITAFVAPLIVAFTLATVFALLGLTAVGYQAICLAAGFAVMAFVLARAPETPSGTHRR